MSVKEIMLAVYWDMKEPITIDFLVRVFAIANFLSNFHLIYWMTLVFIIGPSLLKKNSHHFFEGPSYKK